MPNFSIEAILTSSSTPYYIYLKETPCSPLENLKGVLSQIKHALLTESSIVLAMRKPTGNHSNTHISLYSSSEKEARKFENLEKNGLVTRRDLFYHDVSLFEKQSTIDECIDTILNSLDIDGYQLGVIAAQKGLVFGNINLQYQHQNVSIDETMGPTLIPILRDMKTISFPGEIKYILVVEKEAVFRNLCISGGNRIIITGKGFPDHLTREFLYNLSNIDRRVPIFGFFDSDVYGFMILRNYKFGADRLPIGGVSSLRFDCERIVSGGVYICEYSKGWRDVVNIREINTMRRFLEDVVGRSEVEGNNDVKELSIWKREIQRGLFLKKKAEMNVVDDDLGGYIERKVGDLVS